MRKGPCPKMEMNVNIILFIVSMFDFYTPVRYVNAETLIFYFLIHL